MPPLVRQKWALWAALVSAITTGCSPPALPLGKGRRILFATIGRRPFHDYLFSIRPDGSGLRLVLKPNRTRSYVFASAHTSSGPLLATVREIAPGNNHRVVDRLYLYDRSLRKCRPLFSESIPQGAALLSPDGNRAVYCAARAGDPRSISLWTVDLRTTQLREIAVGDGATGLYPAWGSLGKIAFVRAYRSGRGLLTELMQVSEDGGNPTQLLPPEDGVASATYSADGRQLALWTKTGLEILSTANGQLRLIFAWNPSTKDYIFRSWGTGGLAWCAASGQIAFSLLNEKTLQSDLWVVNEDGSNPRRIYSTTDGQIVVSQFIEQGP
jgi:WD40-like Beta Propeller Repeat